MAEEGIPSSPHGTGTVLSRLMYVFLSLSLLIMVPSILRIQSVSDAIDRIDTLNHSAEELDRLIQSNLFDGANTFSFVKLHESTDRFNAAFEAVSGSRSRPDSLMNLENYHQFAALRLVVLNDELANLDLDHPLFFKESLVERYSSLELIRSEEERKAIQSQLEHLIAESKFFLSIVSPYYRSLIRALRNDRLETQSIFSWGIIGSIALFLMAVLSMLLSESRKTIFQARERTRELDELVHARTQELEKRNTELQDALDLLVEQEKMSALATIVSGVAHEVNTPLGVCITATSYLRERAEEVDGTVRFSSADDFLETAKLIGDNLERTARLIRGFRRITAEEEIETVREFDLAEYLVDNLIPSLRTVIVRNDQRIGYVGPKSLILTSYPGSIAQVVTNLTLNASVHGYGEKKPGIIRIRIREEQSGVQLFVEDEGRGMSNETASRIYDPFFTTNRQAGGTGLGMTLVFNIVNRRLGGRIECTTAPGQGTRFCIHIPWLPLRWGIPGTEPVPDSPPN